VSVVSIENVTFSYPCSDRRYAAQPALNGISLKINEGDFIAIMGSNGAGKTSLCKLINGVIPHSQGGELKGSVIVDGLSVSDTPVSMLASHVAVVHDDPDTQLFTDTVRNEFAFGPENLCLTSAEIEERVLYALEISGLGAYKTFSPSKLSGGQKQRLAIAAAVAMKPRILVLDEPTSQLDPWAAGEVLALITWIRKESGLTVIMATHNSDEAAVFAGTICVLNKGMIAAVGSPREIFCNDTLMRDNWIRRPDVSELASYLANQGKPLPEFPVTSGEALSVILKWLE